MKLTSVLASLPQATTFKDNLSTLASEAYDKAVSAIGDFTSFNKLGAKADGITALSTGAALGKKINNLLGRKTNVPASLQSAAQAQQAKNLAGAQGQNNLSASAAKALEGEVLQSREHFVSLSDGQGIIVEFKSMPEIQEQRQVQYEAVQPPQTPGAFQKYKGTDSVTWQVNATLVSRTSLEASENLRIVNKLRGWTMPYFGNDIIAWEPSKLGAPPPVLKFAGYSSAVVGPIPVVITSLNWTWPKDVDWLPAVIPYATDDVLDRFPLNTLSAKEEIDNLVNSGVNVSPFPAVIQITISLVESLSTNQLNDFNLQAYRAGDMVGAYIPGLRLQINEDVDSPEEAQVLARSGQMTLRRTAALQQSARVRGAVANARAAELEEIIGTSGPQTTAPQPTGDPRASLAASAQGESKSPSVPTDDRSATDAGPIPVAVQTPILPPGPTILQEIPGTVLGQGTSEVTLTPIMPDTKQNQQSQIEEQIQNLETERQNNLLSIERFEQRASDAAAIDDSNGVERAQSSASQLKSRTPVLEQAITVRRLQLESVLGPAGSGGI